MENKEIIRDDLNIEPQDGFLAEVTFIIKEKKVTFTLGILETDYYHNARKQFFAYISVDRKYYITNFSTGSFIGSGLDFRWSEKPLKEIDPKTEVITTNLDDMIEIVNEVRDLSRKEENEFHEAQKYKAERINDLPSEFYSDEFPELVFKRTGAEYKKSYSRKIQGGNIEVYYKEDMSFTNSIRLHNFVTKNGKLRVQRFVEQCSKVIGNKDPREVLQSLIDEVNRLKIIIKNA